MIWFVTIYLPYLADSQNYFQQKVKYKISVKLNDQNNSLTAFENVIYYNNSPDTLKYLYFHLWPNAYKNLNTAMARQMQKSGNMEFYFSNDTLKGYIDSLDFVTNNIHLKWSLLTDTIDICKIILNKPLLPNDSIEISTPFFVKIPGKDFSRLGHYGQSYQVTQWYPKPAVYDKTGWHYFPYLNEGEFYSEFGSFDVSITLPENYFVAATGILNNNEEIKRINQNIEETNKIKYYNNSDNNFPPSSKTFKTLNFKQDSIHDFAWFADKRFHILKGEIELPISKKKVTTHVYFTNFQGELWKKAVDYVNNGLYYYSLWIGEYPYKQCTAVESALGAGGGMEYPMITNIGYSQNAQALENVIVHEVGHNWFYGVLGSNERLNPWMDEGINSYYEQRYTTEIAKNLGYMNQINFITKFFGLNISNPFNIDRFIFDFLVHNASDQPIGISSEEFINENYALIAYEKSAYSINYLKNYLGQNIFDSCMHNYYNLWKFKHPTPNDFEDIFLNLSHKKVDWLNNIIHTANYSDYKILKITDENKIVIKNKGKLSSPLSLWFVKNKIIADSMWVNGFNKTDTFNLNNVDFDKILLDNKNIMFEYNRNNNSYRHYGIFKKLKPVSFKLLGLTDNNFKTQILFSPVVGINYADGFMPGIIFYNNFIKQRKIEYRLLPMYGIHSNKIIGIANINYNIHNVINIIQNARIFINYQNFNIYTLKYYNWQKADLGINIKFKRNPVNPLTIWSFEAKISQIYSEYTKSNYKISNAKITFNNKIKPFSKSCELNVEAGPLYLKSWLECNLNVTYPNFKKGFETRLFIGKFIYNNNTTLLNSFYLSGTSSYNDYKFSETFPYRNNYDVSNIFSHQFINNDGGFGILTPINSNNWLSSLNFKAAIPIDFPLFIYFNVGTYYKAGKIYDDKVKFPYELGLEIKLFKDIFAIYFPVTMSNNIKLMNELYVNSYFNKIRFVLNFSQLVPFKLTNNIISF